MQIFADSKKRPVCDRSVLKLSISVAFSFILYKQVDKHTRIRPESMYLLRHSRGNRLEPSPDLTVLLICSRLISPGKSDCCSRTERTLPNACHYCYISEIYPIISLAW